MEKDLATFDAAWFSQKLNESIVSVEWGDVASKGFVSGIKKVRLINESGETLNLVIKMLLLSSATVDFQVINELGCAREADFYNAFDQ